MTADTTTEGMAMVENIQVTPEVLRAAASRLDFLTGQLTADGAAIAARAQALNGTWQGDDATEFQNAVSNVWQPKLKEMAAILEDYEQHMLKAAADYEAAQAASRSASSGLMGF